MGQKEELIRKKAVFLQNTDRNTVHSGRGGTGNTNPAVIIDQIAALKIERWDDPEKILDEDIICQCLAEEWEIPYKKIDPLSWILNL